MLTMLHAGVGVGGGRLVWEERYRLSAVVVGREMTLFSVCE